MNTFAKIIEVQRFKKVTFYSVLREGEEQNMFLEFINRVMKNDRLAEDLHLLQNWIKRIGDKYGAQQQYFRHEQVANALPPGFSDTVHHLRLYCMRISENAVILFSGDVKTTRYAQECPNVGPHFKEALRLTKKIDEAIREKQIKIDAYTGRLLIGTDFELVL